MSHQPSPGQLFGAFFWVFFSIFSIESCRLHSPLTPFHRNLAPRVGRSDASAACSLPLRHVLTLFSLFLSLSNREAGASADSVLFIRLVVVRFVVFVVRGGEEDCLQAAGLNVFSFSFHPDHFFRSDRDAIPRLQWYCRVHSDHYSSICFFFCRRLRLLPLRRRPTRRPTRPRPSRPSLPPRRRSRLRR